MYIIEKIGWAVYNIINEDFDFNNIENQDSERDAIINMSNIYKLDAIPYIFKKKFKKKLPAAIKPYKSYENIGWIYSKAVNPVEHVQRRKTELLGDKFLESYKFDSVFRSTVNYSAFTRGLIASNLRKNIKDSVLEIFKSIWPQYDAVDILEKSVESIYYNYDDPLMAITFRQKYDFRKCTAYADILCLDPNKVADYNFLFFDYAHYKNNR